MPKNILKKEQIQAGLSQVSRTHGRLLSLIRYLDGSSVAFMNLNLEEKELEDLGLEITVYTHLRYINASKNAIKSI